MMPHIEDSNVLAQFDCSYVLVQCLKSFQNTGIIQILEIITAVLNLDQIFNLEGDECYQYKFEVLGISE